MNEWINGWMNEWMNDKSKEERKEGGKNGKKEGKKEWIILTASQPACRPVYCIITLLNNCTTSCDSLIFSKECLYTIRRAAPTIPSTLQEPATTLSHILCRENMQCLFYSENTSIVPSKNTLFVWLFEYWIIIHFQ